MEKQTQIKLLNELVDLHSERKQYLDEEWVKAPVGQYFDPAVYRQEMDRIFARKPQMVLHASELAEAGSYVRREVAGRPLLLIRGEDDVVRAFFNVCRHRGAQLVGEESGCKRRFSCPYHAWTWDSSGNFIAAPHLEAGFPGLDKKDMGLHEVPCEEYAGWIWVSLNEEEPLDVKAHLGDLDADIVAMDAGSRGIFESTTFEIGANWKILVEGGIEAYHFRVAHRETIAPLFLDNLSSYQCFGPHIRSVLPRSNLPELQERPQEDWNIGRYANVLYTIFPGPQFLVQQDHFVWIQMTPLAADRTALRLSTVVPRDQLTPEQESYWRKNHALTMYTLKEDFDLGEGIQKGLASGANTHLNFGRFEGALERFNETVKAALESA